MSASHRPLVPALPPGLACVLGVLLLLQGCVAVPRDARAPGFDAQRPPLPLQVALKVPDELRAARATIPAQIVEVDIGGRIAELAEALVRATFVHADTVNAGPGCYTLVPEVVGQTGWQDAMRVTRGTYVLVLRWTLHDATGRIAWVGTTKSEMVDVEVRGVGWLAWLSAYADAAAIDAVERARTTMLDAWSLRQLASTNAARSCGT